MHEASCVTPNRPIGNISTLKLYSIADLVAKPFSINEAIAAEERKRQEIDTIAEPKTTGRHLNTAVLNKSINR